MNMRNCGAGIRGEIFGLVAMACIATLGAVNGCSKTAAVTPDPAASASPSASPSDSPSGSPSSTASPVAATAALAAQITALNAGLTPLALIDSTGSMVYLKARSGVTVSQKQSARDDGGPCVAVGDFFQCQPLLLKRFLALNASAAAGMPQVLGILGESLVGLADGSSGSVSLGTNTVFYIRTTATKYSILAKNSDGNPYVYVSVDGTSFSLKVSSALFEATQPPDPQNQGPAASGEFEYSGTYTDETHWSVTTFMADLACSSGNVSAPQNIKVKIAREDSVWKGKAMMYNPRSVGSPTCATTPTNQTGFAFYTDFVANDFAAKESLFIMMPGETDLTHMTTSFDFPNLLTTYTLGAYPDLYALFSPGAASFPGYKNPFCNPASSVLLTWDNTCAAVTGASGVSASDFTSASDWIAPATFKVKTVTLPSSL